MLAYKYLCLIIVSPITFIYDDRNRRSDNQRQLSTSSGSGQSRFSQQFLLVQVKERHDLMALRVRLQVVDATAHKLNISGLVRQRRVDPVNATTQDRVALVAEPHGSARVLQGVR